MTRRDLLETARRLRAIADDAKAHLDHLEQRRVDALDLCAPLPPPGEIEAARRAWEHAEAEADAALRMSRKAEHV